MERRRADAGRTLGPYKRHELLTGEAKYPLPEFYTGYGDGQDHNMEHFISEEMRRDWIENRTALLAFWESGKYTTWETFPDSLPWLFVRGYRGTLPWAATIFDKDDEPEPRQVCKSDPRDHDRPSP